MRPSNNSKTEEKEGQIGLQIQKEAIFLVPKAIARQPLWCIKIRYCVIQLHKLLYNPGTSHKAKIVELYLPLLFSPLFTMPS